MQVSPAKKEKRTLIVTEACRPQFLQAYFILPMTKSSSNRAVTTTACVIQDEQKTVRRNSELEVRGDTR